MRRLSDILKEEKEKVGGKAALGRYLGGLSGQAIDQYIEGAVPSFEIAIKWKESFNENLIDLLFSDEKPTVVDPKQSMANGKLLNI